jgi:hypothetical protein
MAGISKVKKAQLAEIETSDTKQCPHCEIVKPLEDFSPDYRGRKGRQARCKDCRTWFKKNAYDPDYKRNYDLKAKYGITLDEYDEMLSKQDYRCAICGTDTPDHTGRFVIDHCHETNRVRALLCSKCNVMLGMAREQRDSTSRHRIPGRAQGKLMARDSKFLTAVRHPEYLEDELYWYDWRDCYNGGQRFVRRNLKKFSKRETSEDFSNRKFFTPIPSYAKAAVNDVRNAIFQRLRDVSRRNGSENYMRASAGEIGGVDNKGSSMQSFLGIDVLTELLVMGRVGVYVDMPQLSGTFTMADEGNTRPYCYMYRVEDILSWAVAKPEEPGDFTAILLRDRGIDYNQGFAHGAYLPSGGYTRYRFMWIDPFTHKVKMKLYDEQDNVIGLDGSIVVANQKSAHHTYHQQTGQIADDSTEIENQGGLDNETGVINLELMRIPFVMPGIGSSLLKDVYKHQVALLNLGSSDIAYALKANLPLYVEQRDTRAVGHHLKQFTDDDGTTNTSDNHKAGDEARTGSSHGRYYDLKADAPSFIHPSPEPLLASIKLQEKLEDDIRKLVNLAVQNKTGQRAISAEAMKLSDQGLEAGLSYIGLVLENAERQIAEHWAGYESKDPDHREVATIKYPDRYSLKNDEDRVKEATQLAELMYTVPGDQVKKELSKNIVTALLSGKINTATIDTIFKEIDNANYMTSDPEIIIRSHESGLVGGETASRAIGFDEKEWNKAKQDHIERVQSIAEAQAPKEPEVAEGEEEDEEGTEGGMAARGVKDLDPDPESGKKERAAASDTTLEADKKKPVRGEGKDLKKGRKEE